MLCIASSQGIQLSRGFINRIVYYEILPLSFGLSMQNILHVNTFCVWFTYCEVIVCSVIVEALKVDSLQKLCSSLEPILRRVVSS